MIHVNIMLTMICDYLLSKYCNCIFGLKQMTESEYTNILSMWELLHNAVDVMRDAINFTDSYEEIEEDGDMTKDELIELLRYDLREFITEIKALFSRLEVIEYCLQRGNEHVSLTEFEYILHHIQSK